MNLSPNFSFSEFCSSQVAARRGLDNKMPEEFIPSAILLCERVLEPARAALGPILVTSGYRSKKVNTAVGGAWGSQHQIGEAADIIPLAEGVSVFALFEWIYKNCEFDQLIFEYGVWAHVSYAPALRKAVLVASYVPGERRASYAPVTPEHLAALGIT